MKLADLLLGLGVGGIAYLFLTEQAKGQSVGSTMGTFVTRLTGFMAPNTGAGSTTATLKQWANEAAATAGVDDKLFRALIQAESAWNPTAVSSAGAYGLTQLMPATALELGVNRNDVKSNLAGGAKYLRKQLDRFKTTELALAAYNAGPGNVIKYDGIPPFAETQAYVKKVIGLIGKV